MSRPLVELYAHHAMLNGRDPIEAARRFAILVAVEEYSQAWIAAGCPRIRGDETLEDMQRKARQRQERLRKRRRHAESI